MLFDKNEFFVSEVPENIASGNYSIPLVILSYFVASVASYFAINFIVKLVNTKNKKIRRILHICGAFAMGGGIWSMHFVGMLAYKMKMEVRYDFWITLLSYLLSVLFSYFVLRIVRKSKVLNIRNTFFSAILLGLGISSMHYLGMEAMDMGAEIRYLPVKFVISILIAVGASFISLYILFKIVEKKELRERQILPILCAMIMSAAICGMHYAGMSATVFTHSSHVVYSTKSDVEWLAILIATVSIFLLLLTHISETMISSVVEQDLGKKVFLKLTTLLTVILVVMLFSFHTISDNIQKSKNDSAIMNSVGLQRMLMQRYARQVSSAMIAKLNHEDGKFFSDKQQSEHTANMVEQNFNAFLNGGNIILNGEGRSTANIEPLTKIISKETILKSKNEWQSLKDFANKILIRDAKNFIKSTNYEKMFIQTDIAVGYQDILVSETQEELQDYVLEQKKQHFSMLILGVVAYLITLYYSYYKISNPLSVDNKKLVNNNADLEKLVSERTAELQKALLEVEEKRQVLDTIIQNIPLAFFAKDVNDNYKWIAWNKICEKTFGITKEQAIGRTDYDYFPKEEADFFRKIDMEVMEGRKLIDVPEEPVTTARGTWIAHTMKMPIYDADGKPKYLLGMLEDITERKISEKVLQQAIKDSENANKLKSEFLANLSHELRIPMHALLSLADKGAKEAAKAGTENLSESFASIKDSGYKLLNLMNDLLDLSKLESGMMKMNFESANINDVLDDAKSGIETMLTEKNIALNFSRKDSFDYIILDKNRISQVLYNLISNSIKFSENNSKIEITTEDAKLETRDLSGATRKVAAISFSVTDEGVGLPVGEFELVFEKFLQSSKTQIGGGGTGLGLAICKEIVNAHNGRIKAENNSGITNSKGSNRGSKFTFTIPIIQSEKA